ncbi:MAG: cell division/cell wall cluster transcriptional repressor MraZ [Alphaproteobacteria bacterium]|nr:cell division/cell wall cluster transcriptional repressor MraZ [Alphaproteobacteria bacterium]
MALFVGTFTNKIDKKGRVSVPASFRAVRLANGEGALFGFPSADPLTEQKVIECCGESHMKNLRQEMKSLDEASDRYAYLSFILRHARELSFDAEGRVILPEDFVNFMESDEQVTFQGQGDYFYISTKAASEPVEEMTKGVDEYLSNLRKRKGAAK